MQHWRIFFSLWLFMTPIMGFATLGYVFDPQSPHHFFYQPKGAGPFPAVLLLHASTGIEKINHQWAKLLSDQGYVVYMIDSFKPRGWLDRQSVGWDKATTAQLADVAPAYQYLTQLTQIDRHRIGLLGFSMGGFDVLRVMGSHQSSIGFKAAASFYGVCHRLAPEARLEGTTKIFIGADDDRAPTSACQTLVDRSQQQNKNASINVYPQALHGFDNGQFPLRKEVIDERGEHYHVGYHAKAARLSEHDLLAYFEHYLKS